KINDKEIQKRLGSTAKSPRRAVAYKFPASVAQSEILDIHYQVGRTGAITPVAIMKPFELLGSTISRATLHNFDEIEKLDVRIGDTAIIEKAGDIIPKIKSIIPELRPKETKKIFPPKNCPVCDSKIVKNEGEVAYKCENPKCGTRHLRSLAHFTSRDGLNIEGLGEKVLDLLIENKIIEDFSDIFSLQEGDLVGLPLFKEKKIKNLIESIQQSKHPQISKFLFAIGIPFTGKESAEILGKFLSKNMNSETLKIKIGEEKQKNTEQISMFDILGENTEKKEIFKEIKILKLSKISKKILEEEEKISNLEGIGEKIFKSIKKFFTEEKNLKLLQKLEEYGVYPQIEKIENNLEQIFEGKIFVLTGALKKFSREDAKKIIKERGGKVSSSVSKNTDFVLFGESSGEKYEKGKRLGVKLIGEEEFLEVIG
ncbi:NAD-dependent DNA ligase LigA, partial [Candidatus Gracilibacteria bacterium]|nr:NAD-dependent DNA ligase LigA [Candidatus Gracilibacteria bacterium]